MRVRLVVILLGVALLAACDPYPTARGTLVRERRPITEAERASLSDDDGHRPLSCERWSNTIWDHGPSKGSPGGRAPDDELVAALTDLDRRRPRKLPRKDWVELRDADERLFVLGDDGHFVAVVQMAGDPARGVWQRNYAYVCAEVGA